MDELVTSLLDRGLHSACSDLHRKVQKTGCGRIQTELADVLRKYGGIKNLISVVKSIQINGSC